MEKGFHKVTVRKTGFKDASTEATVAEGQTMSFSPVLLSVNPQSEDGKSPTLLRRIFGTDTIPEGKGLVHIRTNPEGATIVVDGKPAPKKTNARWPADPGRVQHCAADERIQACAQKHPGAKRQSRQY